MKRWFKMQFADNDNETGEIMIYDMIGKDPWTGEGMDATNFDTELKALGPVKNINLRINSPGGSVFDGVAIYNMIQSHPAKVTASIDGIAASAASLIAMAADKIVMPENSFMLIHKPMGFTIGTDDEHMAAAADLERMGDTFANAYASRTGQTAESAMALMCEDRLMTASEAQSLGYADEMSSPVKMMAAYDMKRLPEKARAVMVAAIEKEKPEIVAGAVLTPEIVDKNAEVVAEAIEKAAPVVIKPPVAVVEPVAEYGEAEIKKTFALCKQAKRLGMAEAFITAKLPIAAVQDKLISALAAASDALELDTTPAKTPEAYRDEQKKLMQAKLREDMGIGISIGRRPIKA